MLTTEISLKDVQLSERSQTGNKRPLTAWPTDPHRAGKPTETGSKQRPAGAAAGGRGVAAGVAAGPAASLGLVGTSPDL